MSPDPNKSFSSLQTDMDRVLHALKHEPVPVNLEAGVAASLHAELKILCKANSPDYRSDYPDLQDDKTADSSIRQE